MENAPFIDTADLQPRIEDRLRAIIPDDPNKPYMFVKY